MADESHLAAQANRTHFDAMPRGKRFVGGTHLKHKPLYEFYQSLAGTAYQRAAQYTPMPRVLDLGAGDGSSVLPFLAIGAHVTAVEISSVRVEQMYIKCAAYLDRLEIRNEEIEETLSRNEQFDLVMLISALHHIPDYLNMLHRITGVLSPHGVLFTFQDLMRYDRLGVFDGAFSGLAYFTWRVAQPNVRQGIQRRLRRQRGHYLAGSIEDMAEYHIVRNGVDQEAIVTQFERDGFNCEVMRYFSTQSNIFQPIGTALGVRNTFGILAQRVSPS